MKKPKIFTEEHLAKLGKINAQITALFELTGTKMEGTHVRRETINALIEPIREAMSDLYRTLNNRFGGMDDSEDHEVSYD